MWESVLSVSPNMYWAKTVMCPVSLTIMTWLGWSFRYSSQMRIVQASRHSGTITGVKILSPVEKTPYNVISVIVKLFTKPRDTWPGLELTYTDICGLSLVWGSLHRSQRLVQRPLRFDRDRFWVFRDIGYQSWNYTNHRHMITYPVTF